MWGLDRPPDSFLSVHILMGNIWEEFACYPSFGVGFPLKMSLVID